MTQSFNPSNMSGFTQHLFTVLGRFRDVAVDNHLNGSLTDITAHEKGLVSGDELLTYEPPVCFTVFTDYEGEPDTIRKETDTFRMDAAVFDWNWNVDYGMENAIRLTAKVIDNVEANRTLESTPGAGDPVAEDVTWSNFEPGYEFDNNQDMLISWASVTFEVQTRRLKPN